MTSLALTSSTGSRVWGIGVQGAATKPQFPTIAPQSAQAMAFWRLASMAARKSWVFSHGLSLEISSARSLVI